MLNKSDLADDQETKKWISYFATKGIPAVAVDCNTGKGVNEVLRAVKDITKEEQEKYSSKGRIGKAIRIMILGIPNVGKSTFINKLTKKKEQLRTLMR